jgi:hypothetical protein
VHFELNREYLLLAVVCGNGVVVLPQGEKDIFGVDSAGRFLPSLNAGHGFVDDFVALGTVAGVAERIRALSRQARAPRTRD